MRHNRDGSEAQEAQSRGLSLVFCYTYDGFGNLLDQTVTAGTAPSLSVNYNYANNLQTTDCADANGNITGSVSGGSCSSGQLYAFDAKNRIATALVSHTYYAYAPDNKRVWRGGNGDSPNEVAFWSITGQKLSTCTLTPGGGGTTLSCVAGTTNVYFGRKLVSNGTGNVVQDRQGSIGKFYPYGQEKPSATTNGTEKFTAYFRDSETGNDYAINRYHQPGMGRFLSTDPKRSSASTSDPGTWNRYAYVAGDPVNRTDPSGKGYANQGSGACNTWEIEDPDFYDGSNGSPCVEGDGQTGCDVLSNDAYFDAPNVPDCNDQGAGESTAPAGSAFLPTDNAKADLNKTDCYSLLGFSSAAGAQKFFNGITFHFGSYGPVKLQGGAPVAEGGNNAPAWTLGAGQFNINTDYNWSNFSKEPTTTGGTFNYLAYENKVLGLNLTSDQLATLIIIHELEHNLNLPNPDNGSKANVAIYNDCIKPQ